MRVLDGEQVLVRIFIGESSKWQGESLRKALLERLKTEGFAGATAFHATAGFGARSIMHTASILRLSEDLPVLIEVVDTKEKINALMPILDEMISGGMVTMENVRVLKYGPRSD